MKLLLNAEEFCGWSERHTVNALLWQRHGIKKESADLVAQTPHGHAVALGSVQVVVGGVLVFLAGWLIGAG